MIDMDKYISQLFNAALSPLSETRYNIHYQIGAKNASHTSALTRNLRA